jgi:hypothetical protein
MAISRCAVAAICLTGTAAAAELELTPSGRVSVAASGTGEGPSVRFGGFVDGAWQFETGLTAGFGLGVAAQSDRADRFVTAAAPTSPAAPLTGWRRGAEVRSAAKAALVSGYGFLRGGWGEVSIGRDQGAGERFSLGLPSAFYSIGLSDAALDPSGGPAIRLANAPSGAAAKVAVTSARFLGFNAGASYAPREDRDDLSQSLAGGSARLDDIWEAGLTFARTDTNGLRIEAAMNHSAAKAAVGEDFASTHAGLRVSGGPWVIGAAGLRAETERPGADYSAYGVSGTWSDHGWTAMLGYVQAEEGRVDFTATRFMTGIARDFGPRTRLGVALVENRREFSGPPTAGRLADQAWLAELSVRL